MIKYFIWVIPWQITQGYPPIRHQFSSNFQKRSILGRKNEKKNYFFFEKIFDPFLAYGIFRVRALPGDTFLPITSVLIELQKKLNMRWNQNEELYNLCSCDESVGLGIDPQICYYMFWRLFLPKTHAILAKNFFLQKSLRYVVFMCTIKICTFLVLICSFFI